MELPILMLTAKNQIQDKMIAFEAGANDYLVKPCDKQELISRVKTLVRIKTLNQELTQMNLHLEEKVLERTHDLRVAYENLESMSNSRSKLLANIAHELGTPVTLIHNYVQSIQIGLIQTTDLHYRKLVADKINVLNRLIEDLFELSILESKKMNFDVKEFRLNDWLTQLNKKCELMIMQDNRIFEPMDIPGALGYYTCLIDAERMDQLFSNLISNAVKHTEENTGIISFNVTLLEPNQVLIQVSDNGFGIDKENLPFIFDRFFKRTSLTEVDGTGLGLPIVKQIVASHHGDIWLKAKKMKVLFFIFYYLSISVKNKYSSKLTEHSTTIM